MSTHPPQKEPHLLSFTPNGFTVAVVGATGAVGRAMLDTLARRAFPVASLRLMASKNSAGKISSTAWGDQLVEDLDIASFEGIDVALFSAGAAVSERHAPRAAKAGVVVIDNTSAFRMDPLIPLVVPEVNAAAIPAAPTIIANPNCSTIQLVLVLDVLQKLVGLESVRVATYQSASGAGQKGINELIEGVAAYLKGEPSPIAKVHARPLAFNVVPQIGSFTESGYTTEELKMIHEPRKILGLPQLAISATCVRVPVSRSHSEVVNVVTQAPLDVAAFRAALEAADGLLVVDNPQRGEFPTPVDAANRFETFVGRIRKDEAHPRGLVFWVVSDNLLKGAALNAVQIAEHLWKRREDSV